MSEKNEITTVTQNNAATLLRELEEAFFDIPFGNSDFQTENFVIAAEMTPERAYRSTGMQIMSALEAVQQYAFNLELKQIEKEQLLHRYENEQDPFEKRKLEVKIKINKLKSQSEDLASNKFLNDKLHELNLLYKHFKKFPKFTRQQFEAGEKRYYLEKLNRIANGMDGAKDSLIHMEEDIKGMTNFENYFDKLENKNVSLEELENIKFKTLTNLKTTEMYKMLQSKHEQLENKENNKDG